MSRTSKNKEYPEFVIISAELDTLSLYDNSIRTSQLITKLNQLGLPYKELNGVYKGVSEVSFYVEPQKDTDHQTLRDLRDYFNQDSILLVDEDREACLLYKEGDGDFLGKFKQVDKLIAESQECYTHDFVNNGYYICE